MTQPASPTEARILIYTQELSRWGQRMNLVGSTEHDALRKHLQDALAAAPQIDRGARVVDLGTGAGLPGLPILIARPDLKMTLVEARERRVHFVRHVCRRLELKCVILRGRIEEPPAERYDYVLMRALAPLDKALRLAAPWVNADGEIWVWTREKTSPCAELGEISLGERGRILRTHAAEVSSGTPH